MFTKIEVFLVETLLTILPCIFILLFFTTCYYYVLVFIIIMYLEMLFPGNFFPKVQYVKKTRTRDSTFCLTTSPKTIIILLLIN